jgi:hypothetical protein
MIIGLSWAELQACRHWGTPRHREYLMNHRARTAKGRHEVAMPAIGWRTLADRLVTEAFHPSGRHRKTRNTTDGVPATRQAAQKIERALAALVSHPALRGEAVRGQSGEIVIAWPHSSGRWTPYPLPGTEPSFLCPHLADLPQIGVVTQWFPQPSPPVPDLPGLFACPSDHDSWE